MVIGIARGVVASKVEQLFDHTPAVVAPQVQDEVAGHGRDRAPSIYVVEVMVGDGRETSLVAFNWCGSLVDWRLPYFGRRVSAMTSSNSRSPGNLDSPPSLEPCWLESRVVTKVVKNCSNEAELPHSRHQSHFGGSPTGSISFEEFLNGQELQSCDFESRASANFATPAGRAVSVAT